MRSLWPLLLLGCAGAAAPDGPDQEVRKRLEDPARVYELFFDWLGSEEMYGKAHDLLTREAKGALGYEAFCLGVTQARNVVPDGFAHLIRGMRQHRMSERRGDEITVRWCNPDMGYSRDVKLRAETLGKFVLWRIDLRREDLESLKDGLLRWYNRQKDAANGQRLVYPPGWRYASIGECACTREENIKERK